jgi:GNAT superfamily N-acetyltransferase
MNIPHDERMTTENVKEDRDFRNELADLIYAFNVSATGVDDGEPLRFAMREGPELLAGLEGWTWGGTGYIDLLWVREDQRGHGRGTALVSAAEQEAARRGCHQMVLSTHSFQAPNLYLHRGYREYGRIENYPTGHQQLHLVKELSALGEEE